MRLLTDESSTAAKVVDRNSVVMSTDCASSRSMMAFMNGISMPCPS